MVRSRKRWLALGALLLVLVPMLAACGGSSGGGAAAKKKIGLVTDTGGLNDRGFNHLAYTALQKAVTDFGIQGDYKESKTANDYDPFLTQFAAGGYDLVIGVGFSMEPNIGKVSSQFPSTHFMIVDGDPSDANFNPVPRNNVQGVHFKEQDAGALVGVIAGLLEKDGKAPKNNHVIGAVGGVSIPPVNHYIAGYQWAAKMEDPSIKVLIGYSNNFDDPAKCKPIANDQIAHNADIIFQVAGACGLGALQAAGDNNVYSIGVDTDQKDSSTSVIASATKGVDTATYNAIKEVVQGTFQGGAVTFSLANDGVGYTKGNITLPADVLAEVDRVSAAIKAGTLTPPDTIQ
jgi:basic membrane protein A